MTPVLRMATRTKTSTKTSDQALPSAELADAAEGQCRPAIADLGVASLTAMVRLIARQAAHEAMRAIPAITEDKE